MTLQPFTKTIVKVKIIILTRISVSSKECHNPCIQVGGINPPQSCLHRSENEDYSKHCLLMSNFGTRHD